MSNEHRDRELMAMWVQLNDLLRQGPTPEAEALLARLRERARQLEAAGDPEGPEQMSSVLFTTGVLAMMRGRDADAETAFAAAIPLARSALEARPDDVSARDRLGSIHYNLGNIYSASGRVAESETAYRAALPHQEANARDKPEIPFL